MAGLSDAAAWAYSYFGWISPFILKLFPKIPRHLKSSGKRIYAEAYAALVGMAFVFSAIGGIISSIILLLFFNLGIFSLIPLAAPLVALVALGTYPSVATSSLAHALQSEVPHAAAYISVMATSGTSPYVSLQRIRKTGLMPAVSYVGGEVEGLVRLKGMDPLTALEEVAKDVPSSELKELLRGYVSTVRVGGDVTHYLLRQTENIFKKREAKTRVVGERMAMLTEAYLAVTILLGLGLMTIFLVSRALPLQFSTLSIELYLAISYIIFPFVSIFFIYLADIQQPRYPTYYKGPYYTLLAALPLSLLVAIAAFAPFRIPLVSDALDQAVNFFLRTFELSPGFRTPLSIVFSLLVLFVPAAIVDIYYAVREAGIFAGATRFMREVVEVRKTGLAPERSIESLAKSEYGAFSKILRVIANKLAWGSTYSEILRYINACIKNWNTKTALSVFFDAIDTGGGTPETLETLTSFNEGLANMEYAKRSLLRPLMIIPYIGAIVMIFAAVILLAFMRSGLMLAGQILAFDELLRVFLTPLVINVAIMGVVAGKIAEERASAGFKHAVVLLIVSAITFALSPFILGVFLPQQP